MLLNTLTTSLTRPPRAAKLVQLVAITASLNLNAISAKSHTL